ASYPRTNQQQRKNQPTMSAELTTLPEETAPANNRPNPERVRGQKAPKKAVVLAGNRGLTFSDMESMWRFCMAVVNSGTFKEINTPEVALIRLQAGLELGLTPICTPPNIMA